VAGKGQRLPSEPGFSWVILLAVGRVWDCMLCVELCTSLSQDEHISVLRKLCAILATKRKVASRSAVGNLSRIEEKMFSHSGDDNFRYSFAQTCSSSMVFTA
jgi:hypothetical protein